MKNRNNNVLCATSNLLSFVFLSFAYSRACLPTCAPALKRIDPDSTSSTSGGDHFCSSICARGS